MRGERVRYMVWPAVPCNKADVEPNLVFDVLTVPGKPPLCCAHHTCLVLPMHGFGGSVATGAAFHLDERNDTPAFCNQIDFTDGGFETPGKNPIAFELQPECSTPFGAMARTFCRLAAHLSSSARW